VRILWIAILVTACGGPTSMTAPDRGPSDRSTLRVVTYNVNFGLAGDALGVAAVAALAPDVALFQETNVRWSDALIAGLGARLPHHRFAPPPDWPAGGMGVMSRWPIARVDELPSPSGPFFGWRVVIDAPGGPFQVLNLHLKPPMSDGGSWVIGYFSTRDAHAHEAAVHAEALDPIMPAIVVGDFNEESDGAAVGVFIRRGFEDTLAQFAPKTRTWEWPVGSFTLHFQLDHVLYDHAWVAVAGGVAEAGRSDHRPVWVDLERAQEPAP